MIEIYNKTNDLRKNINDFLIEFTGVKLNYYDKLTIPNLLKFKQCLSGVNNILTLKTTYIFVDWLCDYFKIQNTRKTEILLNLEKIKPNSNGFDIELNHENIIAEIKCIVPINNGNYYGAAQRNSILDDAIKLSKGKRKIKDTSGFFKIIGLIDLGHQTDLAIKKLLTQSNNIRTQDKVRIERHNIVKKIILIDDKIKYNDLSVENIYVKLINLN